MGKRKLTEDEYKSFAEKFQKLKISGDKNKEAKLNELYDKMEKNLRFVGASAIEDKL